MVQDGTFLLLPLRSTSTMRASNRQLLRSVLCMLFIVLLLDIGCIRTTPRVIKIGLVAPFEGRYREIGVDIIPAVRLAIREWAAKSINSGVAIELVAYDDGGEPERAVVEARKLAADPDVAIVI